MECSHVQSSCCDVSHYVFMHTAWYARMARIFNCEGREMVYFHTNGNLCGDNLLLVIIIILS